MVRCTIDPDKVTFASRRSLKFRASSDNKVGSVIWREDINGLGRTISDARSQSSTHFSSFAIYEFNSV